MEEALRFLQSLSFQRSFFQFSRPYGQTSMSAQPLGGINVGATDGTQYVILVWWDGTNKHLWVLTENNTGVGSSTVAFQNPLKTNSSGKVVYDPSIVPLQFQVALSAPPSGSANATATFSAVKTSGNYDLTLLNLTQGQTVSGGPSPVDFLLTQSTFQPWTNPASLLTGTSYIITDTALDPVFWQFLPANTYSVLTSGLSFLPISYYYGCTSTGTTPSTSASIGEVVTLAYCAYANKLSNSACSSIPTKSGWVSQTDCVAGKTYSYCAIGTSCSGSCVSQDCATSGQQCLLTTSGDTSAYSCRVPDSSGGGGSGGGGGTSSKVWIIVAIVGGILALIFLFWIFHHLRSKKEAEQEAEKKAEHKSKMDADLADLDTDTSGGLDYPQGVEDA